MCYMYAGMHSATVNIFIFTVANIRGFCQVNIFVGINFCDFKK